MGIALEAELKILSQSNLSLRLICARETALILRQREWQEVVAATA
jgi:hypothetical protein